MYMAGPFSDAGKRMTRSSDFATKMADSLSVLYLTAFPSASWTSTACANSTSDLLQLGQIMGQAPGKSDLPLSKNVLRVEVVDENLKVSNPCSSVVLAFGEARKHVHLCRFWPEVLDGKTGGQHFADHTTSNESEHLALAMGKESAESAPNVCWIRA